MSSQLIEGVDNEITLAFILFTGAAAIAVPWYFFRPSPRNSQNHGQRVNSSRNVQAANQTRRQDNFISGDTTGTHNEGDPISSTLGARQEHQSFTESVASPSENQSRAGPNLDPGTASNNTSDNAQETFRANNESTRINVKVKHNTSDQLFAVQKTMNLIGFKRHCFAAEMEEGKNVRLIYNGRILQGDNSSLEFLGINDGCVIHAQISEHQNTPETSSQLDQHDLELGFLLLPAIIFALILGWIAVLSFDDIFSAFSVITLTFLTILFVVISYVA